MHPLRSIFAKPMPAAARHRPLPLANGLVYVNPDMPGLRRVKRGDSFRYRDAKGQWLRDVDEISRIRQLAIPPAYTDVWICPLPTGICRRPDSTRAGASSTAITPNGGC